MDYMEYRTVSNLKEELTYIPFDYTDNIISKYFNNIIRISAEELVEKHALLDVMYYG